jgi:hypothetical protein
MEFLDKTNAFLTRRATNILTALETTATVQILAVFLLGVLLLASFVPLQQNADGLLFSIMSRQEPTIYYWGADRFGNLTEFLTVWLRNPTQNQWAQVVLQLAAALVAPIFFCSLMLRRAADAWRAAALASCLMLLSGREAVLPVIFAAPTPYGVSLTCAGLAALALRGKRPALHALGATLLVIAYIVNFGLVAAVLPLVGLFAILLPSPHSMRLLLLHVVAAIVGCLLPAIIAPDSADKTSTLLQVSLPEFAQYGSVIWEAIRHGYMAAALVPPGALLLFLLLLRRFAAFRLFLLLAAAMLAAAALYFCVLASAQWVKMSFNVRYFIPGIILMISLGGVSAWLLVKFACRSSRVRQAWFAGLAALLLLATFHRVSLHPAKNSELMVAGNSRLARAVAARYEAHALDGIAAGGMADGYWVVWPAVFMTEQYHYDSGYKGPDVLGITFRGEVRRDSFAARLAAQGHLRLACIDLSVAECAAQASRTMALPGLRASELAPPEPLPGNHRLSYADITPPP